jgi:hypothetical protein
MALRGAALLGAAGCAGVVQDEAFLSATVSGRSEVVMDTTSFFSRSPKFCRHRAE